LIVSGTDTGVGKTVVAAAIAALAAARGATVAAVKPVQTGLAPGEPGDLAAIGQLAGITDLDEYARYPDPLSPAAAARRARQPALDFTTAARRISELGESRRLVIVEGAGGLLVRYDEEGSTIADLARMLHAPVLVVCHANLGTLNHTALTLEVLAGHGLELAGVVIGSWPTRPDLACRSNIHDLETLAARPLSGVLPEGVARLEPAEFLLAARGGLAPTLGGTFAPADFRRRYDPDADDVQPQVSPGR
jgi:dethiobiotin synthetase